MSIILPWENHSYYQRIKQTLWLEESPAKPLLQELTEAKISADTITKVVAYLARYKDAKLEKTLKDKFSQASAQEVTAALTALTAFSIDTGRLKMLDVCERVASLKQLQDLSGVNNVIELAKADAEITPKPKRSYEAISQSFLHQWARHSGVFGKVAQYFVSTVTWSYSIDLETPPRDRWAAQGQWMFFRTLGEDLQWLGTTFIQFFSTTLKAGVAAAGVLATLVGLKYLYSRYHVGTPDSLDKKYFRNLNTEAKAGLLKKTVGRKEELRRMETCLTTPPGQSPRIPILVGEPGVGKTQLVEGLALNIVNGEAGKLTGKKVFVVNTASLSEWGSFSDHGAYASRLDMVFQQIEGFEDQVILFFDEAHNAATTAQSPGNTSTGTLLELLKTKLLERKVLCILATTTEEYDEHIATNKAFADRITRIDFSSLSNEETKILLQEKTGFAGDNPVEVTSDAVDAVVDAAETHDKHKKRANPRKSNDILQEAINYVYAGTPTQLNQQIEKVELEYRAALYKHRIARSRVRGWSLSEAGVVARRELTGIETRLKALQEERAAEKMQFEKISRLKAMEPVYSRREYEMIHLLATEKKPSEEAQKTYLFMQYVLLPLLRDKIVREASLLKEKMPLKVDGELIRALMTSST